MFSSEEEVIYLNNALETCKHAASQMKLVVSTVCPPFYSHLCQIITALKGRIAVIMCVKECVVKVLLRFNHQNIHSQHAHAHLPPTLLHKYTLSVSHSADKSPWLQ